MRHFVPSVALLVSLSCVVSAVSCPFCSAPSLTLTEQFADADAVILAEWVAGRPATETDPGLARFRVLEVSRTNGVQINKQDVVELGRYRAAKMGDKFVLMGSRVVARPTEIDWKSTIPVSDESYAYMANAPSPDLPTAQRLQYFVKFLEHGDEMVALDAYGEFANAPYKDIAALRDQLPREKLHKWVTDPHTPPTRLGLYGLLLGLCGNEDDAQAMQEFILRPSQDYRLGLDGVISGYLLIAGERGLDVLDKAKLASSVYRDADGTEHEIPFSETYSVVGALRFMWTYGEDRVSKDRLRRSMRLLLNRPAIVDLVIPDLARWKDWQVCDRLFEMYGDEQFDQRAIKLAIVKFLYHCSKDVPRGAEEVPAHVAKAQKYLKLLEERDPKMVRDAKRTIIR